jgi:molybdate-binding protein
VATFRDLARAVAGEVAVGTLAPGDAVEPLRTFARSHGASQATALRAYRELADAGVLETSQRRIGRIAPDGALAAARYLRSDAPFRLAASDDPVLTALVNECRPAIEWAGAPGSGAGLRAIADGLADGAAIHLWHAGGTYNAAYARSVLAEPVLLHLWRRDQGLIVAPGNPRRVAGVRDLGGLRVARRPIGSGARSLLDRLTAAAGILLDASDPEVGTGLDVALAVASGSVDAGLGSRATAAALELAFIPLAAEPVEIATSRTALPGLDALRRLLAEPATRERIAGTPGYDPGEAGTLTAV